MKKMLTLMVILSVASLASAAPTWTLSYTPGVVTVSVVNNPGAPINLVMAMQTSEGTLSSFAAGPQAPVDSAQIGTVYANFPALGEGEIWAMAHLTTGTLVYLDGDWMTFNYSLTGKSGTISLYEYLETEGTTPFITSIVVPEPITMSLLAVGGLFLRRKK